MSEQKPGQRLATRLVHAGERQPAPGCIPTSTPVYTSVTFLYDQTSDLDAALGAPSSQYSYARYGNPTVSGLEASLAAAEEGLGAVACASGMAALHLALLAAGTPRGATEPRPRHILAARDLYGSTYTLLHDFFAAQDVPVSYCDITDMAALERALDACQPDVVLIETLSNPLLHVADLPAIVERTRRAGARLVVDATMTTPVLSRPLSLGADVVVHSATKYLGGHGDVVGGALIARTALVLETARRYARLLGSIPGPFEARQIARGMKTLALRVRQQCANALAIACWLQQHPRITRVLYPGLPEHPQHAIAARDFGGLFGGMVSFEVAAAGRAEIFAVIDRLQLVLPATSLGDVFSLISYPAISSHREIPAEQRQQLGIGDGVLRLSAGIEDAQDIIADLEQALAG